MATGKSLREIAAKALLAAMMSLSLGAYAAGSITLTSSSSGDLTVSQALADAGASLSDLTGNVYDDIVVAGDGRILFDTSISAYAGTVHISSGATAVLKVGSGLGGNSVKVYVADGGALIPDATGQAVAAFTNLVKEVHIAGSGPDGAGAVVAVADTNQRNGIWGAKYVLEGNALIASRVQSAIVDFPKNASSSVANLDMNGHTLTFAPTWGTYIPVRMVVANPGHIVVTNANLSLNNYVRLNGSADNTFTVKDGGHLNLFSMKNEGQTPWTLVYDSPVRLAFEQEGGRWDGPVRIQQPLNLVAQSKNGNNYHTPKLELYGPVSGENGILLRLDYPASATGHLYLYSANNSFTGGVVLQENTYLHVMADGAVPVSGAPITMSNAFVEVQANSCKLPSIDCFCSSARTISSDDGFLPGRIVGTLTKRGSGMLDYTWHGGMDGIDLKEGTLKLSNAQTAWYAGVYEGDRTVGWSAASIPPPTGADVWYYRAEPQLDSVQTSFRWLQSATTFATGGCSVYKGWFYCSASQAGKWRFASNVIYLGRLRVDGVDVIARQNNDAVCFGTASIAEGWHEIDFRMGRTGKAGGPNTSVIKAYEKNESTEITSSLAEGMLAAWQNSGIGFAVCMDSTKAEAKTTDVADFVAFPSDPGDGSVLRFVEPGSAAEAALEAEYIAQRTVGSLAATTNTVLDLCGAPLFVGCVTGFPTVVNTSIPYWLAGSTPNLTVTNSWTASAAGIAAGAAFSVTDGTLTFAEGTTLNVPDSRSLRDTHGASLTVATATGCIVGMPTLVFKEGDRRGILRKSPDGKSLQLTVAAGFKIFFR